MAETPYLFERQSEYWTSGEIERFFTNLGFEVLPFPLTQLAETKLPADFIFFHKDKSKLFGFQYKALYHNGEEYWLLKENQHADLSRFPWVYYCLSEMKSSREHGVALHLARIIKPNFEYRQKVYPRWGDNQGMNRYSRWGAFHQGLEKCLDGVLVKSEKHLRGLIMYNSNDAHYKKVLDLMVDMFLADLDSRHAIHFSPLLRGIEGGNTEAG
jgi:hypothetical protein